MKPALVTGASGFLGWHIARLLCERGYTVRALVRPGSRLRELDVERAEGDLRDAASVERAAAGCGLIFHAAADYRLWARDRAEMYRTNVEGTKNVLEAALRAGVERVVYTSTVGCIGIPPGGEGDETIPVGEAEMAGDYKRSKFQAERVALEYARMGAPVVVVNPTAPVGEHDVKPTPTGRIILDFLLGRMPAYIETGLNLVDAQDAAMGHLLACERGVEGERYILGCQNLTLEEILGKLAGISGLPAPRWKIPYAAAYLTGMIETGIARVTGREPRAPLDAVRMAKKKMFVSWEKARRELGFAPKPVEEALRRAVEWFQAHGYAPEARRLGIAS
jgi:dihydroflavonol-4-reductase